MPGNELLIDQFLFNNIGKINLNHLGLVTSLGAPNQNFSGYMPITSFEQTFMLRSEDSRKKADIYINGIGVSLKQSGGSFSFNRLQRANLRDVYISLGFAAPEHMLRIADDEVRMFHDGILNRRSRPWTEFFREKDFKLLLEFLMMKGSPNVGISPHPAELILEAPSTNLMPSNINVYTFEEYFEKYKGDLKVGIRRQWVGQSSDSEHGRALGLTQKPENATWVYTNIVGAPRTGWRKDFPSESRKTVYFLMIEM
jgi:hypothetical protein